MLSPRIVRTGAQAHGNAYASRRDTLSWANENPFEVSRFLSPTDPHWGFAINRAYVHCSATGGGEILLPPLHIPAFAPDCAITPRSNVILRGSGNGTVLTPFRIPPIEAISAVEGVSDIGFRDLTIDLMDMKTSAGERTVAMSFRNTPRLVFDNVRLERWLNIGLALNGVLGLSASRLQTMLSRADPRFGTGVVITRNGKNISSGMRFRECLFDKAGADVLGTDVLFEDCHARDYRAGAGFVSEVDPFCANITYIACVASGARGRDNNGYVCGRL